MTNPTPVAWCLAYDDPRCGRIHSNPSMSKAAAVNVQANACGKIDLVELFTESQLNQARADALREAAEKMKEVEAHDYWIVAVLNGMADAIEGEK